MGKANQVKKSKIIFKINKAEFIAFHIPNIINNIYSYSCIQIFYYNNNLKHLLFTNNSIMYGLERFKGLLEQILENKLELHESIKDNIGYLWNECLWNQKNKKLIYETNENNLKDWVGEKYLLWSTPQDNPETWLYERNGKIFLEITPSYTCSPDMSDKEHNALYKIFLQNYKSYIVTEIDKKTAIKWLKKVNKLIDIIRANDKKCIN